MSVDFQEIEELQRTGDWEQSGAALAQTARQVQAAGADFLLLCTNTMHKVAPQIEAAIDIPFLHLADATAQRIAPKRLQTVRLLGTAFTMEQDFYRGRLAHHGLEVLVPPEADRRIVHRGIYEELVLGEVNPASAPSTCASSTPWPPAATGRHRGLHRDRYRSCSRSTRTRPSSIRPPSTPRLR